MPFTDQILEYIWVILAMVVMIAAGAMRRAWIFWLILSLLAVWLLVR
jgi:hypothetical protein